MTIAIILHIFATVVWVGGMFFAYMSLRPVAVVLLEPPLRMRLWTQVFQRFFPWVWLSILLLLASGYWMIFAILGGMAAAGIHIHIMNSIAIVMFGLFIYLNVGPYQKLQAAVVTEKWSDGGINLGKIRRIIGINLCLGLINIVIGAGGRFLI